MLKQGLYKAENDESWLDSFEDYFRIGDEVTEELVDYFMDLLPPAYMGYGMLQVGEPYSHECDPETEKRRATYTTFIKSRGKWRYVGECFYEQDVNRVTDKSRLARVLRETEREVLKNGNGLYRTEPAERRITYERKKVFGLQLRSDYHLYRRWAQLLL